MKCFHCEKAIEGKSWIHLENIIEEKDDGYIRVERHICDYSCYKRLSEESRLPKNMWSHLVNKDDFLGRDMIRPVINHKKKQFEYLSHNEIENLSDYEKEKYTIEKDKQIHINPDINMIHEELLKEDMRTEALEESGSESDYNEDY